MRVLFFPIYTSTPHFETELELMHKHIQNGDDVYVLHCDEELGTCFYNPEHKKYKCELCKSKFKNGLKALNTNKIKIISIPFKKETYQEIPEVFNNIEELKSFTIGSAQIGLGAASSLISRINREHCLNTLENKNAVYREVSNSYYVYLFFKQTLLDISPDLVYLFNGRVSNYLPAINTCEELKIPFFTHDRAGVLSKFRLIKNTLPHDVDYCKIEMNEYWENENEEKRIEIGNKFYLDNRNGVENFWYSYSKAQLANKLPENFNLSKKNIVFFNSTIEEYAAVRGWENPIPIYGNEINAFRTIFESFKDDESIHFYLRVHPNLKGFNNTQTQDIISLKGKYKNLTIIEPESAIDSYALMQQCNTILTFFSTIGIESVYWGKPAIILGKAVYVDLGSTYNPVTHDEVVELIKSDLDPKDKMGAVKYGFWVLNRGVEFNSFKPSNLTSGKFLGKQIKPSSFALLKSTVLYLTSMRNLEDFSNLIKMFFGLNIKK